MGQEQRLDKEKLTELLKEADDKWFAAHPAGTGWSYMAHLTHTAEYIAKNYHRKRGRNGKRNSTGAVVRERKGGRTGKKAEDKQNMFSMPGPRPRRGTKI